MGQDGTHDEVGVDALDVDAAPADLLVERAGEGGEEGLGAGVRAEHGRDDADAGEGAHVDDQAALPARTHTQSASDGSGVGEGRQAEDAPLDHAGEDHAGEADDGVDVDVDDVLHVLVGAGGEVFGVLVRFAGIVDWGRASRQPSLSTPAQLPPAQAAESSGFIGRGIYVPRTPMSSPSTSARNFCHCAASSSLEKSMVMALAWTFLSAVDLASGVADDQNA